jgi:1-deoxy-D-xylulose-5-phosphate synthase
VVVVLNDNGRAYAPTVGGVAAHLAGLPAGPSLFELVGLAYVGPVDGHDVGALEQALAGARALGRPVVVHVRTSKGCGHPPAEADELDRQHAVPPAGSGPGRPTWTRCFGQALVELGARRPDVVALTAAMLEPTGLAPFAAAFPDRVVDVGIAEQHAVTSAAGLAMGGLHPVVALYATFLNRAFDQVLLDVALHRLPVTFVLDRAGITGSDGPSHNGMWDLSALGVVPGMRVAAPRDAPRLAELLGEAVAEDGGPTAVRFPKGCPGPVLPAVDRVGGADVLAAGRYAEVLVLAVGPLAAAAVEAAERLGVAGVPATVVDPRWLLPVDPALVEAARRHRLVVTVEDNGVAGGFGDAVGRALRAAGVPADLLTLGLRQEFVEVGERSALLAGRGLSAEGIAAAVLDRLRPSSLLQLSRRASAR